MQIANCNENGDNSDEIKWTLIKYFVVVRSLKKNHCDTWVCPYWIFSKEIFFINLFCLFSIFCTCPHSTIFPIDIKCRATFHHKSRYWSQFHHNCLALVLYLCTKCINLAVRCSVFNNKFYGNIKTWKCVRYKDMKCAAWSIFMLH